MQELFRRTYGRGASAHTYGAITQPPLILLSGRRAKAAAHVGHAAASADVADARSERGWTTFSVDGLDEPQRARLVALPTPTDGVRAAYETIVYQGSGGGEFAYTVFVDAQTGDILLRTNRMNHLDATATAAPVALPMAPTAGEFAGSYTPTACGPDHPIDTDADTPTPAATSPATSPPPGCPSRRGGSTSRPTRR